MIEHECNCDQPIRPSIMDGEVICSACSGFVKCDYCDEAAIEVASQTYAIYCCAAHSDQAQEALYAI